MTAYVAHFDTIDGTTSRTVHAAGIREAHRLAVELAEEAGATVRGITEQEPDLDSPNPTTTPEELAARREARGDADPLNRLRHHVTGAIERGEAVPIVEELDDLAAGEALDDAIAEQTGWHPADPNPLEEHGASVRAELATAFPLDDEGAAAFDRAVGLDSIAGNHAEEEAQRLELEEMQRAELEEERRPTVAETIGADLERHNAARELAGAVLEHEGTDSPPEWEQVYALARAVLSL